MRESLHWLPGGAALLAATLRVAATSIEPPESRMRSFCLAACMETRGMETSGCAIGLRAVQDEGPALTHSKPR
jgi:hypothetical protein